MQIRAATRIESGAISESNYQELSSFASFLLVIELGLPQTSRMLRSSGQIMLQVLTAESFRLISSGPCR